MTLAHETSAAKTNILQLSDEQMREYQTKCGACLSRLVPRFASQADRMSRFVIMKHAWNKQELMAALKIESEKLLASLATGARKNTALDIKTRQGMYLVRGAQFIQASAVHQRRRKVQTRPQKPPVFVQQQIPVAVPAEVPGSHLIKPEDIKAPSPEEAIRAFEVPQVSQHQCSKHAYLCHLAELREAILMTGPAGCGKTFAAEQIAAALNLPFCAQSFSEGVTEAMVLGRLLPLGDNGKFMYAPSAFVTLYENGGVFLFDEVDAADANTMVMLNNALAGNSFYLDVRHDHPIVKRHPDFIPIATANTVGLGGDAQYSSRNQLDAATLDRFRTGIVKMDYDLTLEKKIVHEPIRLWAKAIRNVINDRGMDHIVSTRVLVNMSKQFKNGIKFTATKQAYFADWTPDELTQVPEDYR